MAYARLGVIYLDLYQPTLATENFKRAFDLRDHGTEKEKLYITGHYYLQIVGDLQKATETYKVYSQIYPREASPISNLSVIYSYIGDYEQSITEAKRALELEPTNANYYANCAGDYLYMGQFDKSRLILQQARERRVQDEYLIQNRYLLAFLTDDAAEMRRQVDASSGKPGEDTLLGMQAGTEAFFGRLNAATEYTARAARSASRADATEAAAQWKFYGALHDAEAGNFARSRTETSAALASAPSKTAQVLGPLALARSGDGRHAQALADELATLYPSDTMVQYYWLPTIRAAIDLDKGDAAKAVEDLQPALPYDLGSPFPGIGLMYPVYLRGLAYLKLGQTSQAAAEFQKMLDHKGVVQNFLTGALAQLQLARAQSMSGEVDHARASYQDFFKTWKEADAALPILVEAKAEFANLK
jgi:tetratricopeptide (TPR) repeat protein